MPVISRAVEAYRRHKEWRANAGKLRPGYAQTPKPSASDVLEAELDAMGIVGREARDHWWCVWADQVIDEAEDSPIQPPRRNPTGDRRTNHENSRV